VARRALHVRRGRAVLGEDRDPPRGHAGATCPPSGALPTGKPRRPATDCPLAPRGHEGVRDPPPRAQGPGGVRERVRRQLQTGAGPPVTTRLGPGTRCVVVASVAPPPRQSLRRLEVWALPAFADLVELISGMAGLLVHGGDGLFVRTRGEAEDLTCLRVQPVAHVLDPCSFLGFEILLMGFCELLRRNVHPLVDVHECRHEPTSYSQSSCRQWTLW